MNYNFDRGSAVLLADGSAVTQIGTTMSRFIEGFAGATYTAGTNSINALTGPTGQWDIVRRTNTTMTVTLNNGSLAVNMGTTNGDELFLIGRNVSTMPQNLIVTGTVNQRITGNEVRFGYLEVNDAGNYVANPNLAGFPRNSGAILLNGTGATGAILEAIEDGIASLKQAGISNLTTGSITDYSLEARPEDLTGTAQSADSTAARVSSAARLSSVVPNANATYKPYIWIRNVSAPASATTVTLNRIVSMDIQEVQAEIGGGRGNSAGSQAIPVLTVNSVNIGSQGARNQWWTESNAALAANATFTGAVRDTGASAGSSISWCIQRANLYTDQAATIYLEQSQDSSTWEVINILQANPTTAGTAQSFLAEAKIMMRYTRVRVVNGATAQGIGRLTYTFSN